MDCICAVEPALCNLKITLSTIPNDDKSLIAEHKVSWSKYYLELAVDRYAIAVIFENINKQYIVAKCMGYIKYANKTAHKMIAELMTHPVVLDVEKQEICAFFIAPWSDSPNTTLKDYGRQLDKHQRAPKKQRVTFSDEDIMTHFVGFAEDFGLFKGEWVM